MLKGIKGIKAFKKERERVVESQWKNEVQASNARRKDAQSASMSNFRFYLENSHGN